MIKLGQNAKDKITGFEGVAIAKTEWFYGCIRYGLQGRKVKDDGTIADAQWFDEDQLIGIEQVEERKETDNGGARLIPPRNIDPVR